jgi:hypothetical protein
MKMYLIYEAFFSIYPAMTQYALNTSKPTSKKRYVIPPKRFCVSYFCFVRDMTHAKAKATPLPYPKNANAPSL